MMRRFSKAFERTQYFRKVSYLGGLFNFKIIPGEMFPYPCRKMDGDEAENLESVLESVRSNKNILGNLYGAQIATEYGGLGLGHTAHALIYEELGNNCIDKSFSTMRHSGVCTHVLASTGTKDLKGKYLTAMSDGTIKMGWAIEEDGFGSDLSMNNTRAVMNDNGSYVLTGQKRCVDAASATHFLVLAKTVIQRNSEEGATVANRSSLFICANDAKGLRIEGDSIVLENTPVSDVVGVMGEGFKDAMIALFTDEYLYAVSLLGIMKRLVEELQGVNAEEGITEILPYFVCAIYAMESTLYALTANMDIPAEDSLLECTLVSAFVQATTAQLLRMLELLKSPNTTIDNYFRYATTFIDLMESRDFLYSTAVCCGVEEYGLFFQKASTLQMMQARALRFVGVRDRVPIKNIPESSLIDEAVVNFGDAVEATFVKSGSQVPYQQLLLNRLGEAASMLYAASAVASRASMCVTKGLPSAKVEGKLATAFIRFSVERARILSEECCNVGKTADDVYKRIALEVCDDALQ
ncbi:putative acyl-CoA dehydrogenase, mitochondrial precursor [Trypanosoma cruzi]|uniref:Acyl-CoA dehydrogenase, mitochondrial, putative n=2 Tax=Trypanosoma cruzi TaxID=5693 RepID=Q4DRG3_TRYCC|nr:acyl-CoA dehydrogenase, mitochondrial precursor, putative [Trypanosoma cruzi]EAN95100.1 acyl-CoA dehydrogenase, mitochondrial precursor, putative [Trypanosoma cruzi]PWV03695.1 putative acyl-CoA dehydrogenase, mitochondrial precursor [Trypanosoma cruzi]|eukprot:XP_816951.1 acyl-CoA dehydrogenase, mitochondrial precursor [Trypanosoma cruzi strain CL Brener]